MVHGEKIIFYQNVTAPWGDDSGSTAFLLYFSMESVCHRPETNDGSEIVTLLNLLGSWTVIMVRQE